MQRNVINGFGSWAKKKKEHEICNYLENVNKND